jgi:hypothetical protein
VARILRTGRPLSEKPKKNLKTRGVSLLNGGFPPPQLPDSAEENFTKPVRLVRKDPLKGIREQSLPSILILLARVREHGG